MEQAVAEMQELSDLMHVERGKSQRILWTDAGVYAKFTYYAIGAASLIWHHNDAMIGTASWRSGRRTAIWLRSKSSSTIPMAIESRSRPRISPSPYWGWIGRACFRWWRRFGERISSSR